MTGCSADCILAHTMAVRAGGRNMVSGDGKVHADTYSRQHPGSVGASCIAECEILFGFTQ